MTSVDRRTFLALCKGSKLIHSGCEFGVPWLDPAHVKEHMDPKGHATHVASFTGDETVEISQWRIPLKDGNETYALMSIGSNRLWTLTEGGSL